MSALIVNGVRCEKCGAELSHYRHADPRIEAIVQDNDDRCGVEHAKKCGGKIVRFEHEEES